MSVHGPHLLDIERYPHEPLLRRAWTLKDDLTAYDRRLARSSGHHATVELVS
ncbi:MAG TPA: hypothetical protein VFJ14_10925 [Nocardioidaceae bacterium]|nr:hypothetical protein [Nocardioidaceae bacterium]